MREIILSVLIAACAGACANAPRNPEDSLAGGYFISPHGKPFAFGRGESGLLNWLAEADETRDGRISASEFEADGARFFAAVDLNQDGMATPPEVSAWRGEHAQRLENVLAYMPTPDSDERGTMQAPRYAQQMRGRGAQPVVVVLSLLGEREPVISSDADLNRRVTRAEFAQASGERFALLDADGDGALSMEEMRARLR